MHAPVETEIKLLATPAMLDRLAADPRLAGPEQRVRYANAYYDTLGGALGRAGAALRLRTGGESAEQTLKLPDPAAPPVSRSEWTVPAPGERLDPALFPEPARSRLDSLRADSALACFARTLVERTTRRLDYGHSRIEVALDRGTIRARGRDMPLAELELELQQGHAADLFALALELPLGPDLQWSVAGKAARAQALAFDLPPGPPRGVPLRLSAAEIAAGATLAEGLRTICWQGLTHLLTHYPQVLATTDPEAVHQARVAIRRLRAALALFRAGPEARVFAAQFRALARGLAPARDLYLLHERALGAARSDPDRDRGELLAQLAAARDAALEAARDLLAAASFQRLLLQFALWLEADHGLAAARHAGRPYRREAARALARGLDRVTARGERLAHQSDRQRHKLRIAAKSLRYAAEFCPADGVAPARRHRFAKALQRLQDHLGELNDLALAGRPPPDLFAACDPLTRARLAAELKALAAPSRQRLRHLRDRAERALATVEAIGPWWKEHPA